MRAKGLIRLGIWLAAVGAAGSAQAKLGGKVATVQADRTALGALAQTSAATTNGVYDMTLPNGASVKEFANPQGDVFAVTWSGPGKPDLRTLLGKYFTPFQAASARINPLARRQPAHLKQGDLVIETGGHMGYFWGVAYIPSLEPAGFDLAGLK